MTAAADRTTWARAGCHKIMKQISVSVLVLAGAVQLALILYLLIKL